MRWLSRWQNTFPGKSQYMFCSQQCGGMYVHERFYQSCIIWSRSVTVTAPTTSTKATIAQTAHLPLQSSLPLPLRRSYCTTENDNKKAFVLLGTLVWGIDNQAKTYTPGFPTPVISESEPSPQRLPSGTAHISRHCMSVAFVRIEQMRTLVVLG